MSNANAASSLSQLKQATPRACTGRLQVPTRLSILILFLNIQFAAVCPAGSSSHATNSATNRGILRIKAVDHVLMCGYAATARSIAFTGAAPPQSTPAPSLSSYSSLCAGRPDWFRTCARSSKSRYTARPSHVGERCLLMQSRAQESLSTGRIAPRERACGLGLTILPNPDLEGPYKLAVTAVSPYSFAKQAGCQIGDVLLRLDRQDMRDVSVHTLFESLVGAVNSSVVMLLQTPSGREKMVTLRRTIPPPRILRRAPGI